MIYIYRYTYIKGKSEAANDMIYRFPPKCRTWHHGPHTDQRGAFGEVDSHQFLGTLCLAVSSSREGQVIRSGNDV